MENLYVKLLNNLSVGAAIMIPPGRTVFMNDTYFRAINEKSDFLYNAELWSPEYTRKVSSSVFMKVIDEKREVRMSQLYINESRYIYHVMLTESPVLDEDDHLHAILACAEYILPMGRVDDLGELPDIHAASVFIFESPVMREIINRINLVAKLPTNILLTGESGVGKDKLAEYIHLNSDRRNAPFITVNCAAIAENLIESELFGYESGAFTGAGKHGKKGLIEQANGGILFLDEINSLPLNLQGTLLRVLETKMLRRVGGTTEHSVDFRLISASNQNLLECVKNHTFREDLYYRINVFSEHIPPLRERKEDIPALLQFFTANFSKRYHTHFCLSESEMKHAMRYQWPGNVRELRNFAEQMVVLGSSPITRQTAHQIKSAELQSTSGTLRQRMAQFERQIILEALNSNLSKKNAAKELGIDPSVLSRKIAQYNL